MTLQRNQFDAVLEPLRPSGVHPLLTQRASQANFSSEALDRQHIIQLLQAARCAPSSHNSQPWHFIVVRDGPHREVINQSLIDCGAAWAVEAPVLLGVVANQEQGTRQNGLDYTLFDTGLAVQNILLQAASLNLAAHPVNYYEPEVVKNTLNLPPRCDLVLFIAVGYPGNEIFSTEATPLRKPLADIATWDRWEGEAVSERES